jgi:secreted trypsin-like serine protease
MRSAILLIIIFGFSFVHFISATTYTCDPTVSCGCSEVSTVVTARIIGGEAAANNSWGWMLSLQQNYSHICGASLLTSEYAVTAGHCVDAGMNNPSILSIVAGTNYLDDLSGATVQRRTITKVIRPSDYDSVLYVNDIAILQFSPLTISSDSKLAFICLPNANQDPFQTNSDLVAIGWGVTDVLDTDPSNYLQQVTVQVFSSTSGSCVPPYITNASVQFCAGISTGGKGMFFFYICRFCNGTSVSCRHMLR